MTLRVRHALLLWVSLLTACSPIYVARAGIEQARILSRRQPIASVIADPATDADTRRKLDLVLQARDFAQHALGLNAGQSYTTYSWVDSDTLLMVVSGSRKDRFQAYTWWFPIVGHVPYKGYFQFSLAYREAARLEAAGYDAYVRPAGAFSTLGWFNDPLLNTILRYDDVSLVSTVIHEILHNTVFIPGQVSFNESFANFVGDRGAIEFFCMRDGEDSARCRQARDWWADNLRYAAFLSSLVSDLEAIYRRDDLTFDDKLARRDIVFEESRQRFATEVEPDLLTGGFRGFLQRPLNNATLIGTRLYYDRLGAFEAVYHHLGGDYRATLHAILDAARERPAEPYAATAALLSRSRPVPGRHDPEQDRDLSLTPSLRQIGRFHGNGPDREADGLQAAGNRSEVAAPLGRAGRQYTDG
ncbi:MAG TPA: aminopeptidase [Longimicrobiales bacterium]|nr:aminopeptidase [Longimicrobiales bacterium]